MSEEIKLISVEIYNYRQYYGSHKINFIDREKGFTVIFGKNGEGKSNLLNAINWCLYNDEPHGVGKEDPDHESENKSLSIINNRAVKNAKKDTRLDLKVDLWIQKGDTIYSVVRTVGVLRGELVTRTLSTGDEEILLKDDPMGFRIPKGCERLDKPFSNFVVTKKGPHDPDFTDTIRWATPENQVKDILPESLSKYFLLDGEFLEVFWRKTRNIKEGIEQISQLHLLTGGLEKINDHMITPGKGFSKDTDTITGKIIEHNNYAKSLDKDGKESITSISRYKRDPFEEDTYYHSTGQPRIDDLKEDKEKMTEHLLKISEDIKNSGWGKKESLDKEYGILEKELIDLREDLELSGGRLTYNLIKKGPQLMLKNAITKSVELIDKEIDAGGLPVKYKKLFADSLLESEQCICHEPLKPGTAQTKYVEDFRKDLVGKEEYDDVAILGDEFKRFFLNSYDSFCKVNFEDPRKATSKLQKLFDKKDQRFTEIKDQLKPFAGQGGENLIDKQRYIEEQKENLDEKLRDEENKLKNNNKALGEERKKLNDALGKNRRAAKVVYQSKIWNNIALKLEQAYNELKDEIRINVQDTTWENYNKLLSNPSEFEKFSIEPDYTVHLLDKPGFNKAKNLSAGQSLLLTLAFVSAIREPTGYKFPLIVDSPAGKVDGPNTHNIGKCLPDFLPDAQLALLATNKEYTDFISPDKDFPKMPNTPVCQLFAEKIDVQHFKIVKEMDRGNENVGNSTIVRAKLEYSSEKDREGWMVVADE